MSLILQYKTTFSIFFISYLISENKIICKKDLSSSDNLSAEAKKQRKEIDYYNSFFFYSKNNDGDMIDKEKR